MLTTVNKIYRKEIYIILSKYIDNHTICLCISIFYIAECQSILKGALLNVPIIECDFQHHYHKFVVPAKVLAVFIKNHRCEWHTRGQFISKANLDFNDENQLRYLQHDYSRLNKWVIKQCWDIWKAKSTGK